MQKKVKNVIASARVLIRRPSEAKLATDDMNLLLHQILEELHAVCIKENPDFFTHDKEMTLSYNSSLQGFVPTIADVSTTQGFIPVFLKYQSAGNTDAPWVRVPIQKLATYGSDVPQGVVEAAFIGNSFQGINTPHFKLNIDRTVVDQYNWRAYFRIFPTTVLDLDSDVPFLPEFTSLVESILALRSIPLVEDDSPSWRSFIASQTTMLVSAEQRGMIRLNDWLSKDVENRILTPEPYNYRTANPQAGRATGYRVEPVGGNN